MTLLLTRGSRARYAADDVDFAKVLSGRVALALDNAGLFAELETLEAQQAAALGSLAEAVTIQDRRGVLVYANDAAARMLGFPSADALLATPTEELVDAFDAFHEDGSPLDRERLPGRRALAGEDPEPLLVRAIHRRTGEERWRLTKATAVRDAEGRPRLAVNVIEDVTESRRAELRNRFLAQAGAVLASSLDYEETLNRVAQLVVPALADWCGVSMPDDRGYLRSVAVAHVDPAKVAFAREYNERYPTRMDSPTGGAQVMRDMRSQLVNEIPDELLEQSIPDAEQLAAVRAIGMRSGLVVPMVAAGTAIGAITLVNAESRRTFSQADLELAEELGRRAGTAVESARLYTERSQIADTLQSSLLPAELPAIPGYALASLLPAGGGGELGGRRLLRRRRDRARMDDHRRGRRGARGRGRGAHRPGAVHDAHERAAARRPRGGDRGAQPGARRGRADVRLHGGRRAARGARGGRACLRGVRRPPAAAARAGRHRHPSRAVGSHGRRVGGRGLGGGARRPGAGRHARHLHGRRHGRARCRRPLRRAAAACGGRARCGPERRRRAHRGGARRVRGRQPGPTTPRCSRSCGRVRARRDGRPRPARLPPRGPSRSLGVRRPPPPHRLGRRVAVRRRGAGEDGLAELGALRLGYTPTWGTGRAARRGWRRPTTRSRRTTCWPSPAPRRRCSGRSRSSPGRATTPSSPCRTTSRWRPSRSPRAPR
jgi:PAS domain S-box-containing protein